MEFIVAGEKMPFIHHANTKQMPKNQDIVYIDENGMLIMPPIHERTTIPFWNTWYNEHKHILILTGAWNIGPDIQKLFRDNNITTPQYTIPKHARQTLVIPIRLTEYIGINIADIIMAHNIPQPCTCNVLDEYPVFPEEHSIPPNTEPEIVDILCEHMVGYVIAVQIPPKGCGKREESGEL